MTLADPSQLLADYQVASSPLENLRSETLKTLAKVSEHLFFKLKSSCWLLIHFLTIVTSQWHYSRDSDVKLQDKDFKRLNKSALGNRATTAHVSTMRKPPNLPLTTNRLFSFAQQQYFYRQQSDLRIRHPTQLRETVYKKAAVMKGENNLGSLRYGGTGRQGLKKLAPPALIPSD